MLIFNRQDYTTFFVLVNIHYEICWFFDEICKKEAIILEIAICDDNPIDRELMSEMLKIYFDAHENMVLYTSLYSSGQELIENIEERNFDIIILDVLLGKDHGMDVAKKLRKNGYKREIIFWSIADEHVFDAFAVDAADYVVKKGNFGGRTNFALDKICNKILSNSLAITYRNIVTRVYFDEIEYIESSNTKCIIHCSRGKEYFAYRKLDEFERQLSGRHFLRCHRSYIVNMEKVKSVGSSFTMESGVQVAIKRDGIKIAKETYTKFVNKT